VEDVISRTIAGVNEMFAASTNEAEHRKPPLITPEVPDVMRIEEEHRFRYVRADGAIPLRRDAWLNGPMAGHVDEVDLTAPRPRLARLNTSTPEGSTAESKIPASASAAVTS
ncbi:MAG: hypothetical protein ACOC0P_02590, partial [Planctomycetota bacterium]